MARNKEEYNAYMREWYAKNKEKVSARSRELYKNNSERKKQKSKEWHQANRDLSCAKSRERYHSKKVLIGRHKGESHHKWKGENVGYDAIHAWVVREKGRPQMCEHCKSNTKKKYEWANIDHSYKRNLSDFIRLCTSCHRKYDIQHNNYQKET